MQSRFTRIAFLLALLVLPLLPHRAAAQAGKYTYMQMTTIESVIAGGMGRSKVSFTPEFKGAKEAPLENLFSLTGLNMGNLRGNEEAINSYMQKISDDGWELVTSVPLTYSLQGSGLFMTRYIFRKAK
ncbi:hypothetical protein [Hymenobacter chitinivorans]|uniref:DUF4177 domain-containing protein n=1 Tax=Hymenobacter chitinivorans DSM 11115 TaxID=1121954 RepID=A0A2M9B9H8_9BACT|nr:hypothetical protein [Hymenobacter chitinivorans]PJJ54595.1 hypothetical protein CLV45_2936 [Hymenobacter chitinivorans DSM 11115]